MYKGFTEVELELVETIRLQFNVKREEAERHVIDYKKQLVRYYLQEGQEELVKMLSFQIEQYEKDRLIIHVLK